MAAKKKLKANRFEAGTEVRGLARARVGAVKPGKVIVPKSERKPKHKLDPLAESS